MNVLTVHRSDEGPVQTLDDFVGQEVALVFDFLDLVSLVREGRLRCKHLFEQPRPDLDLISHGNEISVKRFLARKHTESCQWRPPYRKTARFYPETFPGSQHHEAGRESAMFQGTGLSLAAAAGGR